VRDVEADAEAREAEALPPPPFALLEGIARLAPIERVRQRGAGEDVDCSVRGVEVHASIVHPNRVGRRHPERGDGGVMDFWEVFWIVLVFGPCLFMWGYALFDLFRRDDIGNVARVAWMLGILAFPWIGALVYMLTQPYNERAAVRQLDRGLTAAYAASPTTRADQLSVLADLHDRGKVNDNEYAAEKQRILNVPTVVA
jgi:hypothetical protein